MNTTWSLLSRVLPSLLGSLGTHHCGWQQGYGNGSFWIVSSEEHEVLFARKHGSHMEDQLSSSYLSARELVQTPREEKVLSQVGWCLSSVSLSISYWIISYIKIASISAFMKAISN